MAANATEQAVPAARSLYGAATPAVVVQPGAARAAQLDTGGAPVPETPAEDAGDVFEHWSEAGQYAPRPGEAAPSDPAPRQTRVADAPLLDEGPRRSNASTADGFVLEPPEGPRADPRAGYAPAGGAVGGGTPPRGPPQPGAGAPPFVPGQPWAQQQQWPLGDGSPWHTTQSHLIPEATSVLREGKLSFKDLPTDVEEYRRWRYATMAAFVYSAADPVAA